VVSLVIGVGWRAGAPSSRRACRLAEPLQLAPSCCSCAARLSEVEFVVADDQAGLRRGIVEVLPEAA
jgi:hypothetical protein